MANEDKKDFNAMLHESKDMPKIQVITDQKSIKKYGGDRMYFAPPMILLLASKGSSTPSDLAVAGISCITPMAPALETALELKFDSAFATAFSKFDEIPYTDAASSNIESMLSEPKLV